MLTYVMYRDTAGQYRWRCLAGNNRTIADSGESYYNKADCRTALDLLRDDCGRSAVQDKTGT